MYINIDVSIAPTLKETMNARHIDDIINKHAQKYCSLAFLSIEKR